MGLIPQPWQSKPPPGTPINWSHPLAQGLVLCFAFNEGGGNSLVDLTAGQLCAISGDVFTWTSTIDGSGANQGGNGFTAGWNFVNVAYATVFKRFQCPAAGSIMGLAGFQQGGAYDKQIYLSSSSVPTFSIYDGISTKTVTASAITPGQTYNVAGVARVGNIYVYVDGVEYGPTSTGVSYTGYTAGTPNMRDGLLGGTSFGNVLSSLTAFWSRPLSQVEIASFSVNPWQIFQPMNVFTAAAAVLTAARPMIVFSSEFQPPLPVIYE